MNEARNIDFFETGIFTVGQVARLTRIPDSRVRRWMRGYSYPTAKGRGRQGPLWTPVLPQPEGALILSFNELIEIRAIDKFCQVGVSLIRVRQAIDELSESEEIEFPFSSRKIITDGSALYSKLIIEGKELSDDSGRPILVELGRKKQVVSYDTILNTIVEGLGFEGELVSFYFPDKGRFSRVVVDPRYAFGYPTIKGSRLEVEVLALAFKSHPSIGYVAEWFEIEKESVEEAVSFHEQFLAA